MAAFDNAAWIGSRTVRPTETQLDQIRQRDPGLYGVGMDYFMRHLGYFQQHLAIQAAIADATVNGLSTPQLIPCKAVAVQFGCETSASATSTVAKLEKAPAATPTVFATMVNANVDIKTAAGIMQTGAILDDSEDIAVGDRIRLAVIAVGAGAVVGARCVVHCFRL